MALAAAGGELVALQRQRGRTYLRQGIKVLLDRLVSVWIFMGGLVLIEPSPYEFMFAVVLVVSLFAGLKIYRAPAVLLLMAIGMAPFAFAGAFQATFEPLTQTLTSASITIFLMLTAFFSASYVAEAPQERMRRILFAYTIIAVLSAIIGAMGYLHAIPGAYDILTVYGRAKAFFKDPNVFGPFLIVPAMFAAQRVLLLKGKRTMFLSGTIVLVLLAGVLLSFSRAAWGSMVGASVILFVLIFAFEANAREKVRLLILGLGGVVVVLVALGALLSIPAIGSLFTERAAVEQSYDSGDMGRFGRQGYAFDLALSHPLGIGPGQFRQMLILEEPHDSYVTVIHVYGWGGALIWYSLLAMTLYRGGRALFRREVNRRLLIPLMSCFIPLVIEAGIIDIDHWRYLYLLCGLIWGVTTGYTTLKPGENRATAVI